MEYFSRVLSLLVFQTIFWAVSLEDLGKENSCSDFCSCLETESQKLEARCNVTGFENSSSTYLFGPNSSRIYSLDLSGTNLRVLYTRILQNLTYLTILNLQSNDMRRWHGNVSRDLPNLVYLNVTGNQHWLPSNDLLSLSKLRVIGGVWWRKECGVCSLVNTQKEGSRKKNCSGRNKQFPEEETYKNDSKEGLCGNKCEKDEKNSALSVDEDKNESKKKRRDVEDEDEDDHDEHDEEKEDQLEFPFPNSIKYGQVYRFYKHNFITMCEHQEVCKFYEVFAPYDNARFTVFKGMNYILYSLGAVSMLINLVVIVTVLARLKLRKSPSFVLIATLASSDFLTGLYSILQANLTSFISFHKQEIQSKSTIHMNEIMCYVSGYIFTTAQVTSPMTSLLLTVERYLVIVNGLNPEKRLTKKKALVCSLIAWIVAMVTAAVPFFVVRIKYHEMSHCSLPNTFETNASLVVRIALYVAMCSLVVPYIIGILLYLRIYIIVKRSGQEMGNRSDLLVAKKISLLVFSNLIFFVIPTVLLYFHSNFYNNTPESFTATLTAYRAYLFMFSCFPLLCFNINSCLNPFLFALRNHTFKQQLVCLVKGIFVKGNRSKIPMIHMRNRPNHFNKNTAQQRDVNKSYCNEGIQLEEKTTISEASQRSS